MAKTKGSTVSQVSRSTVCTSTAESTWAPLIHLCNGTTLHLVGGLSHGEAMDVAAREAAKLDDVEWIGARIMEAGAHLHG
jgi:hypothetical protein